MVGYLPRPAEPFVFSFRNFPSCKMLTDILHVMGIFMGGRHNEVPGLPRGRPDRQARQYRLAIMPGVTYITGSAGPTTSPPPRARWWCAEQSLRRFVDKVPYVTAPGGPCPHRRVRPGRVREKAESTGELRLIGLFGKSPEADLARAAREACGWDLQVAPSLRRFEAPSADELALVRLFDPRRYFLGE